LVQSISRDSEIDCKMFEHSALEITQYEIDSTHHSNRLQGS